MVRTPWVIVALVGCGQEPTTDSSSLGTEETDAPCDLVAWFVDGDGDGYGGGTVEGCTRPADAADLGGDCDDADPDRFPGADEWCDGHDDDCDGTVDEPEPVDASTWFPDTDHDGFGAGGPAVMACEAPADHVSDATDCDDADPTAFPGADETCDGADDDCNLVIDDDTAIDAAMFYEDADGDGHGVESTVRLACDLEPGWATAADDCNDLDDMISPSATEVCDPADVDEDCDQAADNLDATADPATWTTFYGDGDGDGFGDAGETFTLCDPWFGYVLGAGDCDDGRDDVYPGAVEHCDGADEDCNLVVDDPYAVDAPSWFRDSDGDGHGTVTSEKVACTQPLGWSALGDDCDDTDENVLPGGVELCDPTNTDEDCDLVADDADPSVDPATWLTWFVDEDKDSWGVEVHACDQPPKAVDRGGDCDDDDPTRSPGRTETCDDIDSNCNGDPYDAAPGELLTWFPDADGDGFGADEGSVAACFVPDGFVAIAGDCDDELTSVHPGAPELCFDLVDDDCDGAADPADETDCGLSGFHGADSAGADEVYADIVFDGFGAAVALADLDGDGREDVVVGAPGSGIVRVVQSPLDVDGVSGTITGPAGFGTSVARLGDFDGDGYGDLAVGSPDEDDDAGAVYVFRGAPGFDPFQSTADAWIRIAGEAEGDRLGEVLAGGEDADGDGLDDLLAGAPDAHFGAGAAYLVVGGTLPDSAASAALVLIGEVPGDAAGSALAFAGDVDADGAVDLLVGACDSGDLQIGAGEAYLVRSPLPRGTFDLGFADASFVGTEASGEAGCAVAAPGDIDGDGYDDVVVGAPGLDGGAAWVFRGPIATARHPVDTADHAIFGTFDGDERGAVLAGGDLDADGRADLVVGAPEDGTKGSAFLFYGPVQEAVLAAGDAAATFGGAGTGDDLPSALATGDVDGDGTDDLLVGAEDAADGLGGAWLFLGGSLNVPSAPTVVDNDDDSDGDGFVENEGDCDDTDPDIAPDRLEVCGNQIDDDCDGVDEPCAPVGTGLAWTDVTSLSITTGCCNEVMAHHAGDVNGDGLPDLLVTDGGDVCVYLGPIPYGVWGHENADVCHTDRNDVSAVQPLGDFDGDGVDDVAVAEGFGDFGSATVFVYRGGPHLSSGANPPAADLEITGDDAFELSALGGGGDLNGDGLGDLVLGAQGKSDRFENAGEIYVFLGGRAPGVYHPSEADVIVRGQAPWTWFGQNVTIAGDVTGDGLDDLLVASSAVDREYLDTKQIFLLRGPLVGRSLDVDIHDSSFFVGPFDLKIDPAGDLDGDGYDDLVLTDLWMSRALVYFGPIGPGMHDEDGADFVVQGTDDDPVAVFASEAATAGDIDGDGYDDLQIRGHDDDFVYSLYVFYGPLPRSGERLDVDADLVVVLEDEGAVLTPGADVDGDGYADLLVTDEDDDSAHLVRGGRRGYPEVHVVELDPNADGDLDGFSRVSGDCDDTRPTVLPGGVELCHDGFDQDCDGIDPRCAPTGENDLEASDYMELLDVSSYDGGDVDGDGLSDLVIGTDEGVHVLTAPFSTQQFDMDDVLQPITAGGDLLAVGDADGDGLADVWFETDLDGEITLAPGRDLLSVWSTLTLTSTPDALLLADTQGDGSDDPIVVDGDDAAIWVFADPLPAVLTTADATTTLTPDALTALLSLATVSTGDLDGDGLQDLLVASQYDDVGGPDRGRVSLFWGPLPGSADMGQADLTFQGIVDDGEFGDGAGVVGDVTGDGAPDLLVGAPDEGLGGVVRLYSAVPAGPIVLPSNELLFEGTSHNTLGIAVGEPMDLDGDGFGDIAFTDAVIDTAGSTDGAVYVFYGPLPATGLLQAEDADAELGDESIGRAMRTVGDTDGDGTDDLLVDPGPWLVLGGLR